MSTRLEIAAAWERTDEGSPGERACFGLFTIRAGNAWLTEGHDSFVNTLRDGPLVSAYHAELTRLIGDRIVHAGGGTLYPATRAYTYRQKMQRSFAAELLSPFDVDDMLAGDYSTEYQQDVAEHLDVSPITIRTLLVNHGRIERADLAEEPEAAAA